MLCCLQIAPQQEKKTVREIEVIVPHEYYSCCFHLTRVRTKKYHGYWHDVNERLLPGYVFIDCTDVEKVYEYLRKVPTLTKMLGFKGWYDGEQGMEGFLPLKPEEDNLIRHLALGNGAAAPGLVEKSGVELEPGKKIRVISGPLLGMESQITKIDRHRREVTIGIPLLGRVVEMKLGIEDVLAN
ncbi:MAG: hypothetical protein IK096_00270 [Lachnospiraceae bacterium]|nr:hypothetical protein [Lachnospiraceae bacterium]